jgi:hypothetical protein
MRIYDGTSGDCLMDGSTGLTIKPWDEMGISCNEMNNYPLVNVYITMENHHAM